MKKIQAVGVYCGSYDTVDELYRKAACELGECLAHHKITMIYGGGVQGLMGAAANSVVEHQGRVIGFMPKHLEELEKPNHAITELHVVDTMHTRKRLMFEHSDAFFILPGGFGTLDETFELITWYQLALHEKPIIFINVNHYWRPLEKLIQNIFNQHFAKPEHRKCFTFVSTVAEAFQVLLEAPTPATSEPLTDWV